MKDVAFSCDDNGAKFLRVTVWSLLKHYRGSEPIRINVFEGFGGHSKENKKKLQLIVDEFNEKKLGVEKRCRCRMEDENSSLHLGSTPTPAFCSLRYINVEKAIEPYADLIMNREKSRWNVFTWTPIFTPMLLEDATGNVAHFDIDMLFNDDVSKILDLDLGDNLIAAVTEYGRGDPVITEKVWGKGILPPEAERYFNTGTIVFNTAKCREERTWEKILEWYRDHYDIADRIEQDAWNALYWKRTKLLPLRWNFHDRLIKSYVKWDLSAKFWQGNPPRECLEAALNPAILHFWGPKKPWKTSHRPYRKLYHEAMRSVGQTPPKESTLSVLHNLINTRNLRQVADRLQDLVQPGWRRWRRRCRIKVVKHALEAPFEWLGIGLALSLIVWMPRRMLFAFCDVLSALMYAVDRRGKRLALDNLRTVRSMGSDRAVTRFDPDSAPYSPTRAEALIIRRSYRNMARSVGYAFWTCVHAKARCAATGEIDASTRAFLAANNPVVAVSGHLGCWEILSQLVFLAGHRLVSVAKGIGTRGMTALLMRARRSIGQEIVLSEGALKSLMAGIRAGKSLGLLVDQKVDPDGGGVWIRFFGRPMPVSPAPAFFAAKGKAPIMVMWSRPLRNGCYRGETVDTITAAEARDIWGCTQRIATDIERIIRRHPSCWILNYNYFREPVTDKALLALETRERSNEA